MLLVFLTNQSSFRGLGFHENKGVSLAALCILLSFICDVMWLSVDTDL